MTTTPWIVSWTAEHRFEVRPCRWAGGAPAVWQPFAPGEGVLAFKPGADPVPSTPMFTSPHVVRQRHAIASMLCSLCGEPTGNDDAWWFGFGSAVRVLGKYAFTTAEPPLHKACAEHAAGECPRLRDLGALDRLRRFPAPSGMLMSMVGGEAMERDFGLRLQNPVVGALKFGWRWRPDRGPLGGGEVAA